MKKAILDFFFINPSLEINIRSLAKKLNSNPMSTKRAVERLEKENKILIKKKKLESIISLNKENTLLERRFFNIKKIIYSGVIDFLEEFYEFPKAIVLFGSYSFAEDAKGSDIDIAVFTDLKKIPNLSKFEEKLSKKIDLFQINGKSSSELRMSVYNGVVLKGRL